MKSRDIWHDARWYIAIALFSISMFSSLAILTAIFYTVRYLAPVDRNAKPIQLKIVRGMSSQAIADQLARNDLIHNPWIFLFVTHFSGASHRLQVGTYQLSGAMNIPQIIDHIETGKGGHATICGSRRFNGFAHWETLGKSWIRNGSSVQPSCERSKVAAEV